MRKTIAKLAEKFLTPMRQTMNELEGRHWMPYAKKRSISTFQTSGIEIGNWFSRSTPSWLTQ